MIKANEAKAMVKANIQKDEEVLNAKVQKFLDENCETAILESVEKRMYESFVKVPSGLTDHTSRIVANLTANGYKAQVRYGYEPAILIMWN